MLADLVLGDKLAKSIARIKRDSMKSNLNLVLLMSLDKLLGVFR